MGVRVRLRIGFGGSSVLVVALVNTGFEGDVPEVLIPVNVAERLGVWPRLPDGTVVETYRSASGLMKVYRFSGGVVELLDGEKVLSSCSGVYIVVSEVTDEVLMNDQLISRLGIVIEDPAAGLWRIKGEDRVRSSVVRRFI